MGERDDLLLLPYPSPAVDVALVVEEKSPKHLSWSVSLPRSRAVKRLALYKGDEDEEEAERKEDVIDSKSRSMRKQERAWGTEWLQETSFLQDLGGIL